MGAAYDAVMSILLCYIEDSSAHHPGFLGHDMLLLVLAGDLYLTRDKSRPSIGVCFELPRVLSHRSVLHHYYSYLACDI